LAAILVANPTRVFAKVSPSPKTPLRLKKAISICCLPYASDDAMGSKACEPDLEET
jgi:hypothetical protein